MATVDVLPSGVPGLPVKGKPLAPSYTNVNVENANVTLAQLSSDCKKAIIRKLTITNKDTTNKAEVKLGQGTPFTQKLPSYILGTQQTLVLGIGDVPAIEFTGDIVAQVDMIGVVATPNVDIGLEAFEW
jgi:hypothetical protein